LAGRKLRPIVVAPAEIADLELRQTVLLAIGIVFVFCLGGFAA
jgi:hypothetical protein